MTTITLRNVRVPAALSTPQRRAKRFWIRLQSLTFDSLYFLLMQRGRLGSYAPLEAQETAIENQMRAYARSCGCHCCRLLIGLLERADSYDQSQAQLVVLSIRDNEEAAAPLRTLSGYVDGALVHESSGGRAA